MSLFFILKHFQVLLKVFDEIIDECNSDRSLRGLSIRRISEYPILLYFAILGATKCASDVLQSPKNWAKPWVYIQWSQLTCSGTLGHFVVFPLNPTQAAPDVRIGGGQWRRAPKIWSKLGN